MAAKSRQPLDGGFFTSDYLVTTAGPQLYTGPESAPVLRTGTFTLTDYFTGGSLTLVVTPVGAAAVPEPTTWTLMLTGFGRPQTIRLALQAEQSWLYRVAARTRPPPPRRCEIRGADHGGSSKVLLT